MGRGEGSRACGRTAPKAREAKEVTDQEREVLDLLKILKQYAPKIYAHWIGALKALSSHVRPMPS